MAKKESKKPVARPTRKAAQRNKAAMAKPPSPAASAAAAPNATLAEPEIKKIQGLLESETADGVALGLTLLESLGATSADYEAVFTETVIKAILHGWVADSWGAVGRALVPYGAVAELFRNLAEAVFMTLPHDITLSPRGQFPAALLGRHFNGLELACIPTARRAFLENCGKTAEATQPFMDLAEIPAGTFTMGHSSCVSRKEVRIPKPFRMGRTVVTQAHWQTVMGTEPWRYRNLKKSQCGDTFPAVFVCWDDAVLFCRTLSELERETGRLNATQSYRLPTEVEWEYACRAGTTTEFSFGDDPNDLDEHGWYKDNSGYRLHRVALKKPNPWGLYDMHGNVAEWCWERTDRGGGWKSRNTHCSSSFGCSGPQWVRARDVGFRVVVEL